MNYVLGLVHDETHVLLTQQLGSAIRFDGICEPGATAEDMDSAARHQVGLAGLGWIPRGTLETPAGTWHLFTAVGNLHAASVAAKMPIKLSRYSTDWSREPVSPHLRWLLPFLLTNVNTITARI